MELGTKNTETFKDTVLLKCVFWFLCFISFKTHSEHKSTIKRGGGGQRPKLAMCMLFPFWLRYPVCVVLNSCVPAHDVNQNLMFFESNNFPKELITAEFRKCMSLDTCRKCFREYLEQGIRKYLWQQDKLQWQSALQWCFNISILLQRWLVLVWCIYCPVWSFVGILIICCLFNTD